MPSTTELQARTYKRGEKVRLVDDLPGVPAGTAGKISVANGFAWARYWVRFTSGEVVGHVDHHKLVRAKDYERFVAAREREAVEAERAAELAAQRVETAASESASDSGVTEEAGGGDVVVNGVTIPPFLLERSAAARTRLGA